MKESKKYIFLVVFLLIAFFSFKIIQPFITPILLAAFITYIFWPVHKRIRKKITNPEYSALLSSALVVIIFLIPMVFVAQDATVQAKSLYAQAKETINEGNLIDCENGNFCDNLGMLKDWLKDPLIKSTANDAISRLSTYILEEASAFVFAIPKIILNIFVTFFVAYYIFRDGDGLAARITRLLPFKKKVRNQIFDEMDRMTYAVIWGSVVIALLQGLFGGLGFWIFGASSPIIAGALMAIFAFIPLFGTAFIWGPAGIIMMLDGIGHPSLFLRGLGLILYGAIVVASIDNLLKPKLISSKANIHPVLILIGVIGGLAIFGFIGFFIGPLILALFESLLKLYETGMKIT